MFSPISLEHMCPHKVFQHAIHFLLILAVLHDNINTANQCHVLKDVHLIHVMTAKERVDIILEKMVNTTTQSE